MAHVNRLVGRDLLPEASALMTNASRLPGFDGKAKMSKSLAGMAVVRGIERFQQGCGCSAPDCRLRRRLPFRFSSARHLS